MPLISDRAICLRRHEFSETSQILSLLTERHGLIRVIARGAHRTTKAGAGKFDGGVDLLDEGDALFTDRLDKDLNTLAEWKLDDGHRDVRGSQRSLYLALYLAEIVGNLLEAQDPHPAVFRRFRQTLDRLATPAREEEALAMSFDAAADAGLEPSLSGCVECGASLLFERGVAFSPERGGALCRYCEPSANDAFAVDPRLIAVASSLQRLPRDDPDLPRTLPRLTRRQTDPLHVLVARHLEQNTGRPLRMLRWVADPNRARPMASIRRAEPAAAPVIGTASSAEAASLIDAAEASEPASEVVVAR